MTGNRRRSIFLAGSVIAVVAGLPWIAAIWTKSSLFGFPVTGFLLLLLGPILFGVLAGIGTEADDMDQGERET